MRLFKLWCSGCPRIGHGYGMVELIQRRRHIHPSSKMTVNYSKRRSEVSSNLEDRQDNWKDGDALILNLSSCSAAPVLPRASFVRDQACLEGFLLCLKQCVNDLRPTGSPISGWRVSPVCTYTTNSENSNVLVLKEDSILGLERTMSWF